MREKVWLVELDQVVRGFVIERVNHICIAFYFFGAGDWANRDVTRKGTEQRKGNETYRTDNF